MVHSLLSFVLVATQVLSWSASPLYLCMSADGSLCVDFGPSGCHCCQHLEATAECAAGHDACHEHEHGQHDEPATGESANGESDPCGCDHIQISEPQAATLVRAVAAPDSPLEIIPPAALPNDPASSCCLAATRGAAHRPSGGRDAPSTALLLLASVVIQC